MKYWVFDLDGTLVDSLSVHFEVMEKVFSYFGISFSTADQKDILKLSARQLPDYFGEKFGPAQTSEALQMYENLTRESIKRIQQFPGINFLLSFLRSQDRPMAVWTARDRLATELILETSGIKEFFSIVVTGSCVTKGKPNPEGLEKIADFFQATPEQMIMVGDFETDMRGAQSFKCKGVRVLWHSTVEKQKCSFADYQFEEIPVFFDWIKNQI